MPGAGQRRRSGPVIPGARRVTPTGTAAMVAVTAALALTACGDDDATTAGSLPVGATATAATPARGTTTVDPAATSAASASSSSATRLVSRSTAARRALRGGGAALLGPPVVVGSVDRTAVDGPTLHLLVRFRLAREVDLVRNGPGLDGGGFEGRVRGRVTITGVRASADVPFARPTATLDMEDAHGFTPNSRGLARGWCYGAEVGYLLAPSAAARTMAGVLDGRPRSVRIAVASRGGGTSTYAVPIYLEDDGRIPAAARATGCGWP